MAERLAGSRRREEEDQRSELSNSAARADTIREAVAWLAEREAERKAINAEIAEYKQKHIKGDLGFKIADFNAIYRVSQLEVEDRDALLDTLREGFAALEIGGSLDWVAAAEAEPPPVKRGRGQPRKDVNGATAEPNEEARRIGREDGLGGVRDHAARWAPGEPGHDDYEAAHADGAAERARVMALGEPVGGATAH